MGFSYLQSKVITIDDGDISDGARVSLSGLPDNMHWFGCNFFWTFGTDDVFADVAFYDGPTSTSRLLTFDCFGSALSALWNLGAWRYALESDSYMRISDGLEVEFTFASGSSSGDAIVTVFYQ